jgi:hypothetical protein
VDGSVVVTALATLAGVGLGAWLPARMQQSLQRQGQVSEGRRERRAACVSFLAAHRIFRRVLLADDDLHVALVQVDDRPDEPTAIPSGASTQWAAYEQSYSNFLIMVDSDQVKMAADAMRESLTTVMRSRATYRAGAVPNVIVVQAVSSENAFAAAVQANYGLH